MKIPIVYLYLQKAMEERMNNLKVVTRDEAKVILTRRFSFPKVIALAVMKEMEDYKLIELVDRSTVKIINTKHNDILDNTSKMWHEVGIW